MGFKIFQRDRRGAEETKAGAELLEQLEEVWKLWKEMREELGEYRELKKGTVTIGIPMNQLTAQFIFHTFKSPGKQKASCPHRPLPPGSYQSVRSP